ncbi:MAG: glycosyltransferase [Acidobacteriota bacterium]|nr:glycosyltransferase [Acidobacteriota bacterium]
MTAQQLRIAFFNAQDHGSGAEDLIQQTVEGLIARGVDARLYAANCKTSASYVHPLPFFPAERKIERTLRRLTGRNDFFFPSTSALGRRPWIKDADIWHFHNLHGHFISIPLLATQSREHRIVISPVDQFLSTGYCPYTFGCERYRESCGKCPQLGLIYPGISRDATSALLSMKKKAISNSAFNVLVHTDYLARHYASTFVSERPIDRIYYGIDTRIFHPMDRAACAATFKLPPSRRFTIGLFHSFVSEKRKGIFPILSLLRSLADRMPDRLEVLVVGNESEGAREYETDRLPITTLPFLRNKQELAMALNLCDVLLYPTQAENLSLTCLKALACGVPVISSRVGGQPEAIRDAVNGFLCEPNQNEQIVERTAELATNGSISQKLSAAARQTAVEQFDIKTYVDNLLAYYLQVLERKIGT